MAGAAIFDLDRTVVTGSSSVALVEALRSHGLVPIRHSPVETLLFGVYELVGEVIAPTRLAQRSVELGRGWDEKVFVAAGAAAATRLLGSVAPFVSEEMVANRRGGQLLVMATASPDELARPLAAALGFDDVIATRYGRSNGALDGTIDGDLIWGERKWAAVKQWSRRNGVDLHASVAYSDSIHDLPLLAGVRSAVAVNPDARLAQHAKQRGWPVRSFSVPAAAQASEIGGPPVMGSEA